MGWGMGGLPLGPSPTQDMREKSYGVVNQSHMYCTSPPHNVLTLKKGRNSNKEGPFVNVGH